MPHYSVPCDCCESEEPPNCCKCGSHCCWSDQSIARLTISFTGTPGSCGSCGDDNAPVLNGTYDLPADACTGNPLVTGGWSLEVGTHTCAATDDGRDIIVKYVLSITPVCDEGGLRFTVIQDNHYYESDGVTIAASGVPGGPLSWSVPVGPASPSPPLVSITPDCTGWTAPGAAPLILWGGSPGCKFSPLSLDMGLEIINNKCCKCANGDCVPTSDGSDNNDTESDCTDLQDDDCPP